MSVVSILVPLISAILVFSPNPARSQSSHSCPKKLPCLEEVDETHPEYKQLLKLQTDLEAILQAEMNAQGLLDMDIAVVWSGPFAFNPVMTPKEIARAKRIFGDYARDVATVLRQVKSEKLEILEDIERVAFVPTFDTWLESLCMPTSVKLKESARIREPPHKVVLALFFKRHKGTPMTLIVPILKDFECSKGQKGVYKEKSKDFRSELAAYLRDY